MFINYCDNNWKEKIQLVILIVIRDTLFDSLKKYSQEFQSFRTLGF